MLVTSSRPSDSCSLVSSSRLYRLRHRSHRDQVLHDIRLRWVRCRVSVRVNLTYLLSRPLADSWVPLLPRRRLRGCPLRGNRWCKPVQLRGTSSGRTTLFKKPLACFGGRTQTARQTLLLVKPSNQRLALSGVEHQHIHLALDILDRSVIAVKPYIGTGLTELLAQRLGSLLQEG